MLIDLNCPSCNEHHAIPDNFAGGVYRCQKCGTLMSVPKTAEVRRAREEKPPERVSIPVDDRRPGGSVSRGGSAARSSSSSSRSGSTTQARPGAPAAQGGNRWLIPAISLGALTVAIVVVLAIVLRGQPQQAPPTDPNTPVQIQRVRKDPPPVKAPETPWRFEYNAGANPITLDKPNVLGVPLYASSTVILDGDPALDDVRSQMEQLIAEGLGGRAFDPKVGLLYANAADTYAEFSHKPLKDIQKEALADFFKAQSPSKLERTSLVRAVGQSENYVSGLGYPGIILVLGHSLSENERDRILDKLYAKKASIRLDIITVGDNITVPNEIGEMVRTCWTGGKIYNIPKSKIRGWAK